MKLIDVTVPLGQNLPAYPGNTPFYIKPVEKIAKGASSHVSSLHMSAHSGTYVDAPRHFFDDVGGADQLLIAAGLPNLLEVEPGFYDMNCLSLRIVGCVGAPARVILRRS